MNENEIVTGTEIPTESVTAAPVSEESVVSNESSVPDTEEMTGNLFRTFLKPKVWNPHFHCPKA